MAELTLGTTMFSLTPLWHAGADVVTLLERLAEAGCGPAIEVIGHQAWRGFPALSTADERAFRDAIDRLGLRPVALGVYTDLHRRPGQPMTTDEALAYLRPQLEVAARLGFGVVRAPLGMDPALLRRVLDAVGLFDEAFFIYSEETDLCRRIAAAGLDVHWFPDVTVVHHVGHTTVKVPERRINEMWRSRHRYWRKHHSAVGARVAALSTGIQYALRAGVAPLAGRDPGFGARMRLHVHDAWRVTGPGLRELAEEWNGRVGAASH